MSTLQVTDLPGTRADPFAAATRGLVPRRPRLLSYVGRWGRARRWLPADALRVLDLGCAFGYGSAAVIARGPEGRAIVGVERDPELLLQARRHFPWLEVIDADLGELPMPDSCADAVLLLDVIEHLAEPGRALAEAYRVMAPGGALIVTTPHRGPTRGLDSVNLYTAMRRRRPSWPALEGMVATEDGEHRHFSVSGIRSLLGPSFTVERAARTGLGLQELVNLAIQIAEGPLRAPRAARALGLLHLAVYVLDDMIPTGPFAYHLAVRAHSNKREEDL
jgi:SAM-dependent methyltransferase